VKYDQRFFNSYEWTIMRIAVMGAGAVGAYFGAKLSASGHNAAFLARGAHLDALRREGLRVDSPGGNLHIQTRYSRTIPAKSPSSILSFSASSPTIPTQLLAPWRR
jgi:Ketopantoate reductase PanE/ApbA